MRVGFDASILGPATARTGGGRYAQGLLRGLLDAIEAPDELVAFGPATALATLPRHPRLSPRELRSLPIGKLSAIATYLWRLPRLARDEAFDVVHAPFVHTRPSLPPVPAGLPCPLVVTVHDVIPLTFYAGAQAMPARMARFYRWNLRRALAADRIVTVSEAARQEIIARAGGDAGKIDVVHNGVDLPGGDTPHTCAPAPDTTRPFVLSVGSFEPRKNLVRLVEAFDRACDGGLAHDLVLVAGGSPRHGALVHEAIARMKHRGRARVVDDVDDARLAALYRAAGVFAFPSLAEGFGLPPLEAMRSGTPVVASRIPAHVEVLRDGAWLVDPLDTGAIAEGIVRCATDEALRARLIERGLSVAGTYAWDAAARAMLGVYRRAIAERTRGAA